MADQLQFKNPEGQIQTVDVANKVLIDRLQRQGYTQTASPIGETIEKTELPKTGETKIGGEAPKVEAPKPLTESQQAQTDLANFYSSQYDKVTKEFENYTKDIEAIDAENSPIIQDIKDTFARRAEETKAINQAMQGQVALGNVRTGLGRYAPQMATGLVSAETTNGLNRLSELETQKASAIQKAKDALKSTAKDRWTTFSQYMQQATDAYKNKVQAVIDLHKSIKQEEMDALNLKKAQLETQQLEQEVLQSNLSNYAAGFVDFDEEGNVTTADPEELQQFAEEYGIPYSQIVGAVRNKAYELSKLSQEDRLKEMQIIKAQNELVPQLFQEYNYAKQSEGYTGTWQQFLKEKQAAEQAPGQMPTSYKEWQLAGGQSGTGKTYAQYISGGADMTDKQRTTFMQITNKYQADSLITAGIKGSTAISIADDVLANPGSAGNQLKVLYTLVKNLDPDSAVREGELSLASQTQSYFDKYKTYFDRISQGKLLSEAATKELAQATKDLSQNWYETAKKREQQYVSQSNVAGVGTHFGDYLKGFERPWDKQYSDASDFIQNASEEEKTQFNTLRQSFPDKTPQEVFELLQEGEGFNEPLSKGKNGSNLAAAIGQYESGMNYNARGKDGEIGAYQIMPGNYVAWAKEAGVNPNDKSKEAQDKIAQYKVNQYLQKYNYDPIAVAIAWNAGPGRADEYVRTGKIPQMVGTSAGGGAYNVPKYVQSILNNLS